MKKVQMCEKKLHKGLKMLVGWRLRGKAALLSLSWEGGPKKQVNISLRPLNSFSSPLTWRLWDFGAFSFCSLVSLNLPTIKRPSMAPLSLFSRSLQLTYDTYPLLVTGVELSWPALASVFLINAVSDAALAFCGKPTDLTLAWELLSDCQIPVSVSI